MMKLKMPREQKQQLIEQVQHYFELERSEEIGTIAAEQLLDHMVALLGPHVYNQAIQDARKTVVERMQAMEDELYALEKNVSAPRSGSR
ncbi:hypothetical protein BBD42_29000 [Paenibacillus sp. BIHB 4019]|uniref:DUF2164 domain-containing protein n=1 Tax=Paenibacillus sp. BIHB 4019 TaxID=1870819 RepID=A0A1B2DQW0_9BACL|nr:DUF2164 domain-containing protein [Paenibacillus sp. BIHB 4019]ANY70085.1 hypothetical protein BBD42_29000 [Paenibacillus sp. BIHB 4019]